MSITSITRQSTVAEIAAEMDRRGDVIERLEAELLRSRPFSSYPDNREELLTVARKIQASHDGEEIEALADKLSDMVIAILDDEKTVIGGFVKIPEYDNPDGPQAA